MEWGVNLQSEHERRLTEKDIQRPVVVTDYPVIIKAFYMYANDDDRTVRAMDVLVPRIGEIVGGSQREHRLDVLTRRIEQAGLSVEEYDWYLDLRRYGSVPHAGLGLGFERLVQHVTGTANIRDVVPFPRVPGYAEFQRRRFTRRTRSRWFRGTLWRRAPRGSHLGVSLLPPRQ